MPKRKTADPGPTVAVYSLGCRANQEEIECLLGSLVDRGFRMVPFGGEADWTVINTCSVTSAGESDARQAIRRAVRTAGGRVVVTGCYAQRDPAGAAALGAHLVVGNSEKWRLPDLITTASDDAGSCTGILFEPDPTTRRFLRHGRLRSGYRTRAALKIQDGCDERCTYCIIPSLRGRSVSRPVDEILSEARALSESACGEITLTGIHTASYGAEPGGCGVTLARLLTRFLEIEGLRRIRINSLEPQWVDDPLIGVIASSPRFCRHLHLPLQSGDPSVLKRMGRGYAPDDYRRVVMRAREAIPGVAIGADVMVGFPGEDEAAFSNTVGLLESVRPAYLHVFPYSERPGVSSLRFDRPVDERTKRARARVLAGLDATLRAEYLRAREGEEHEILIEGRPEGGSRAYGVTDNFVRVVVSGDRIGGTWEKVRLRWIDDPRKMAGDPVETRRAS
jgi:threonylcarbamoyladenosine tRNA methylthiotransferase MtaB